nr:Cation transport regulator-like protein 2 [Polyrhizophydium stewartii]
MGGAAEREEAAQRSSGPTGAYTIPDAESVARRQLELDSRRMYQDDVRRHHHHAHELADRRLRSASAACFGSKKSPARLRSELAGSARTPSAKVAPAAERSHTPARGAALGGIDLAGCGSDGVDDGSADIGIDSERLFALTIEFLEKHGLGDPITRHDASNDDMLQVGPDGTYNREARHAERTAIEGRTKATKIQQDPQQLHDAFMRFVSRCILRGPDGSRPGTRLDRRLRSSSATSQSSLRPSDDESEGDLARAQRPRTSTAQAIAAERLSVGKRSEGEPATAASRPATGVDRRGAGGRPESAHSKTRKVLIQSRIKRPHVMTLDEADLVRDFLELTAPFNELRKSHPPTLADWYLANHGKEPIWNSKAFSVKKYIMLYLKSQAAAEQAILERQRALAAGNSGSAAAQSRQQASNDDDKTAATSQVVMQRRGNLSSAGAGVGEQLRAMFFVNHPETIAPFKKSGFERTPDDIKILFRAMRGIKAFKDLSDFILGQLCGVLKYQEYEPNRAVFRQGDQGTAWYIILSGACTVQISKTGRIEDSIAVATLNAGSGFGDLALVNDKPRAATILTAAYCELVSVEKADYNRIIKFIHEKEMKEKTYFLRKIPMFSEWPTTQLRQIAQIIIWRKFAPGAALQTQGQKLTDFQIIKTGTCHLFQELKMADGKAFRVEIGTLGQLEYFGEEGVVWEETKGEDESAHVSYAKSTIIAGDETPGGVEVAVITNFDARARFKNNLVLNPVHDKNAHDLLHLHRMAVKRKVWDREKTRTINRMVRERLKDPNMTAARWKALLETEKKLAAMWVFGYGSLIWKVDFPVERSEPGYVTGFVRRFWQGSEDHRGTPERPGRVLTLVPLPEWQRRFAHVDPHPATRVWGVVHKVPDAQADEVRRHLDHREKNGYDTLRAPVFRKDGSVTEPEALIYIATTDNEMFLGPAASLDAVARHIYECVGPSGPNKEYLYGLDKALRERFDETDPHVADLARLVRELDGVPAPAEANGAAQSS